MKACSGCAGGVMFIPDEIERVVKTKSYKDIVKGEVPKVPLHKKLFGGFGKKPEIAAKQAIVQVG